MKTVSLYRPFKNIRAKANHKSAYSEYILN